jgi:hypothetical protein
MQNSKTGTSSHHLTLILGFTLSFGAPFMANGFARTQQNGNDRTSRSLPDLSSPSTPTNPNKGNSAPLIPVYLDLTEVLNAAKLNLDVGIARSQTLAAKAIYRQPIMPLFLFFPQKPVRWTYRTGLALAPF